MTDAKDDYMRDMEAYISRLNGECAAIVQHIDGLKSKIDGIRTAVTIAEQFVAKHVQHKQREKHNDQRNAMPAAIPISIG